MNVLKLTDTFTSGIYNGTKVEEVVDSKGLIFQLIKEGFVFDDEVLKRAHITKSIRDVKFLYEFSEKNVSPNEQMKELPKESVSMKQILRDINAIGESEDPVGEIKPAKEDESKKIISANDYFEDNNGIES